MKFSSVVNGVTQYHWIYPSIEVDGERVAPNMDGGCYIPLKNALLLSGLVPSNKEAKRLIKGGGVTLNNIKVLDHFEPDEAVNLILDSILFLNGLVIGVGKKRVKLKI